MKLHLEVNTGFTENKNRLSYFLSSTIYILGECYGHIKFLKRFSMKFLVGFIAYR